MEGSLITGLAIMHHSLSLSPLGDDGIKALLPGSTMGLLSTGMRYFSVFASLMASCAIICSYFAFKS